MLAENPEKRPKIVEQFTIPLIAGVVADYCLWEDGRVSVSTAKRSKDGQWYYSNDHKFLSEETLRGLEINWEKHTITSKGQ